MAHYWHSCWEKQDFPHNFGAWLLELMPLIDNFADRLECDCRFRQDTHKSQQAPKLNKESNAGDTDGTLSCYQNLIRWHSLDAWDLSVQDKDFLGSIPAEEAVPGKLLVSGSVTGLLKAVQAGGRSSPPATSTSIPTLCMAVWFLNPFPKMFLSHEEVFKMFT